MSDLFNENGLQTATASELRQELETAFRSIYGEDVLLDSSTPDGQLLNIFVQKGIDVRGLLMQLYNSFNPDNSQGAVLDQRCSLNNVFRKAGTFTTVTVTIVADREVTLQGVDDQYNNPEAIGYTIQDNEGNRFVLANTTTLSVGNNECLFRSEQLGQVIISPHTLTVPVTIVLGVISVDNDSIGDVGSNEESDEDLRIRRRQSVALGSFGYLNGLQGSLLQLDGVNDAKVYENYTSVTDANGIPAHSIWVVMSGGSTADIAETIYSKKCPGTGMKGTITYDVTTPAQTQFTARWDNVADIDYYIRFDIKPIVAGVTFDQDGIKQYMRDNINLRIGDYAETASITDIAQKAIESVGGQGYAVNVEISTDQSNWEEYLEPIIASRYVIAGITITEL